MLSHMLQCELIKRGFTEVIGLLSKHVQTFVTPRIKNMKSNEIELQLS